MIFIYVHLAISLIAMVMLCLQSITAAIKFREQYPDMKIPKSHWADKIFSVLRICVTCIFPVFNIVLLIHITVNGDDLIEDSIVKLYKKYSNEGEQLYE